MRILIVSHEYPPVGGGGANACMNLAREYARLGHTVDIVTTIFEGLLPEESVVCDSGKVHIHRLSSKRKKLENCGFAEMLGFLLKALPFCDRLHRKSKFDICQVFFAIPSGPIGYWLKLRYKLPYIIRFGGGDIPGFQERFSTIYKLIGPWEKILWKRADALVANSKGLQEMATRFYDKKSVEIIPNGANLVETYVDIKPSNEVKTLNSIEGLVEEFPLRILFVSRLIARKGLQDVLPMLVNLSIPWQLTIVGDGPYRGTLESMVNQLDLQNRVNFVGQKDKSELSQYYSNSDVFILPSHKEGMPNVVLEAMSFGLPIIMTHCEGSDELIDGNGYIADVSDFVAHIETLYKDRDTTSRMGQRSRHLIDTRFRWEMVARQYVGIMMKIVKS